MKNRMKKRFWAVLCAAAIMAGMVYPVPAYAQERAEAKNVSLEITAELEEGKPFVLTEDMGKKKNYFKFTAQTDGTYRFYAKDVEMQGDEKPYFGEAMLYDGEGNFLEEAYGSNGSYIYSFSCMLAAGKTYYLEVNIPGGGGSCIYVVKDDTVLEEGSCGEHLTWKLYGSRVLKISGTGGMEDYESQKSPWYGNIDITAVIVEDGVASVGANAFEWCTNLETVKLGKDVAAIGEHAFYRCKGLKSITIPQGVKSLGAYAFRESGLEEVEISNGVNSLPEGVFAFCNRLSKIVLPESLEEISYLACYHCSSLTEIDLPENLRIVEGSAFAECASLKKIIFPSKVEAVGQAVLYHCGKLQEAWFYNGDANFYTGALEGIPSGAVIFGQEGSHVEKLAADAGYNFAYLEDVSGNSDLRIDSFMAEKEEGYRNITLDGKARGGKPPYQYQFYYKEAGSQEVLIPSEGTETRVNFVPSSSGTYTFRICVTDTQGRECSKEIQGYKVEEEQWGQSAENKWYPYRYETESSFSTANGGKNDYEVYDSCVYSSMTEDSEGNFMRVEADGDRICAEYYSPEFELLSRVKIKRELSGYGGCFIGKTENYIVYTKDNLGEGDNTEVFRIVKYDKNWNRMGACSIYGANTQYPCKAGSLRMTEIDGKLYVHTCHQMYKAVDGLNHQACMFFELDQASMELTQHQPEKWHASHSFNQFVMEEGKELYWLDHCDARDLRLTKSSKDNIKSYKRTCIIRIGGASGANETGLGVGGMSFIGGHVVTVGNSVDQSAEPYSARGKRNIFVTFTDPEFADRSGYEDDGTTEVKWLTSYEEDSPVTVRVPHLVKASDDLMYVLWEEENKDTGSMHVKAVGLNGEGESVTREYSISARLSDCAPIYTSTGKIAWFVSGGSRLDFYCLDPASFDSYEVHEKINLEECQILLTPPEQEYVWEEQYRPEVKVQYGDYYLRQWETYKVDYKEEPYSGTVVVTVEGIGLVEGKVEKEFIIPKVDLTNAEVELSETSFTYDGFAKRPEVTVILNGKILDSRAYEVIYKDNIKVGTATVTITGRYCHAGEATAKFTIVGDEEPADPDQPTEPGNPTDPDQPESPADPENPTDPDQPESPAEPGNPTDPDQPESPTEPGNPTDPNYPESPADPENPTDPEQPESPTEPDNPTDPDYPLDPEKPSGKEESNKVENGPAEVPMVLELSHTGKTLKVGQSFTLKASITPKNPVNRKITWKSDKPAVASVSQKGKITAKTSGTAIITVKCGSVSGKCKINVKKDKIKLLSVKVGKKKVKTAKKTLYVKKGNSIVLKMQKINTVKPLKVSVSNKKAVTAKVKKSSITLKVKKKIKKPVKVTISCGKRQIIRSIRTK